MENLKFGSIAHMNEIFDPIKKLVDCGNTKISHQSIKANSCITFSPSPSDRKLHFLYILDGSATLEAGGESKVINKDEYFYLKNLNSNVVFKNVEPVMLLNIIIEPSSYTIESFPEEIRSILNKIGDRDNYTHGHCERVMDYSVKISQEMNLEDEIIRNVAVSAAFHDVGKYFISNDILLKKSSLTAMEFNEITKHPVFSRQLLEGKFSKDICEIVETHHERNDGSGYPFGLNAFEIRIEAKIISVADSFDAMTSKRVYKEPMQSVKALEELESLKHKYEPSVVHALKNLLINKSIIIEEDEKV